MIESPDDRAQFFDRLHQLLERSEDDALHAFLAGLHAADVADCLEQVEPEQRSRMMFLLPPRKWAEAIALLEEAIRSDVLDDLTDDQVSDVLRELPADDAVDVLDELDEEVADKIVEQLPPEQKAVVEPLRQYEEDTAGGLMNPDFVSVPAEGTVGDALSEIRRLTADQTEVVYYIYCVDALGRLKGVVPPMRLITSTAQTPVRDLLLDDLFTANAADDQEEVKNKFEKYDVAALPVIDHEDKLLGVITHDDVLDVAEEEAEEDMLHMAGTDAEEFSTTSILHAAGVRAKWLLPCLIGTFVGVMIILSFRPLLEERIFAVILAFLTPIAAMGGNAGVQISTVVVRALATNDPLESRLGPAISREFRIVIILGIGAGILAGLGALGVVHSGILRDEVGGVLTAADVPLERIALAVGSSMTIAVLISGSLATTLPFAFRRLGIDPAIATGPLITTTNDVMSACIYLSIAFALLT